MFKRSINSSRMLGSFATFLLCFLTCNAFSQSAEKPLIRVEKMEYNYYPWVASSTTDGMTYRVILANDTLLAKKMKQSIISAIKSRWNATVLKIPWELNKIEPSFKTPKLKTELKKGIPDGWYLFFQVTDSGPYRLMDKKKNMFSLIFDSSPGFESLDYSPYYMRFKAVILDSKDGSVVFSKETTFEMQRKAVPDGQILLRNVPALADSFLQAFDSAVQHFFSADAQTDLKLQVTPACVFLDVDKVVPNSQKLNFITKNDSIIEQLQLKQEWIIQNATPKKIKGENKSGENIANAAFNILLGLQTDQISTLDYKTKFGFLNLNEKKQYSFEIQFTQENRVQTDWRIENYATGNGRSESTKIFFNYSQTHYILCEKDTIGSFKITKGNSPNYKNHFSQCWDGQNESSITTMPEFWYDFSSEQNKYAVPFAVEGEIKNVPFVIETSKGGNQEDILINGKEIATLKIYNKLPVLGLLYSQPTDEKLFYLLLMLSSMPINSIL